MDSNCFLPTFPLKIQWHNEELAFFSRDTEERRHRPRGWQSSRSIICYVLGDVTLLCIMDSPIFITLQSVSGEIRFGGVSEIWRWPCLSMRCAYIFFLILICAAQQQKLNDPLWCAICIFTRCPIRNSIIIGCSESPISFQICTACVPSLPEE